GLSEVVFNTFLTKKLSVSAFLPVVPNGIYSSLQRFFYETAIILIHFDGVVKVFRKSGCLPVVLPTIPML
ncbi:MAG: hypothetical protein K6G23_01725, partial [Lachnospiraceae bacterium]|nr:hypothetical protein [Lachnospiraceae bacterium]